MGSNNRTPMIGILVSKADDERMFKGDIEFFIQLLQQINKSGSTGFLFTLDDIQKDYIQGYTYSALNNKWKSKKLPYPHVIYNRIASRKDEATVHFLKLKKLYRNKNRYFFNPGFFDKWKCYKVLASSDKLKTFLPNTWLYTTIDDLLDKLTIQHSVYIKPIQGFKGNGIYKLTFDGVRYTVYKRQKKSTYSHADFVSKISKIVQKKPYIIQSEIHTDTIGQRKYDLRVICINGDSTYRIKGIGIRQAEKDSIITHVPNGGDILSVDVIKHKLSMQQLETLADSIGYTLARTYGFIGEFSIDIGLEPNGHPIVFEVNSKPMKFDEDEIQTVRIKELGKLCCQLANTTVKSELS
ncbi:YheC/YheD family endospore coat-associated protein [Metabacillus malikii]|uniref:ATP-grasp domain-containing protein n=1 Tax=Metabacillus malikii TaxID=1504265 RepID=A0ABT9ZK32_9BACI|nr:YheC/YheD family protein [Metabacillus malikii]MDQ0232335.1 hypothetical protein [Metabacillus malikii]